MLLAGDARARRAIARAVLPRGPYDAAVRLTDYALAAWGDLTGRCAREGVALESLPSRQGFGVILSYLVDDVASNGISRFDARQKVDDYLRTPSDPAEAERMTRENWGLSPEAIAAAARNDALFPETA